MEGYHNTSTRDEFSKQAAFRCFTCDDKGHTSKQYPSKALFCGNWNKPKVGVKDAVVQQGFVRHYFVGIGISQELELKVQ